MQARLGACCRNTFIGSYFQPDTLADWMDVQIHCHRIQNRNRNPNQATLGQTVSVSKPGALVAMSVSRMKFL